MLRAWATADPNAAFVAPPPSWVPPLGAPFAGAEGAVDVAARKWRAAGERDGSWVARNATDDELDAMSGQPAGDAA